MSDDARAAQRKELDVCLDRFESRADGARVWPELLYSQPFGFRALTMSLAVPPGQGPHPLVVYIHGGGWMLGHPHAMHPNLAAMHIVETLLAAGYAVARPSYRLSGEGKFPTQLQDLKTALRYLRHHGALFNIAPDRIAALGESAGGHLAVLLGLETPPDCEGDEGFVEESGKVQAVINWYGVTDMLNLDAHSLPTARFKHDAPESASGRLIGGRPSDNPEAARRASPITWVTPRSAPMLIQHGTSDSIVPPRQGESLYEALRSVGVSAEWHPVEGADHCFIDGDTAPIMPAVTGFLGRYLKV
ncbi:putative lipase/esterase [Devosia sp. LC5]|uniref:alpha/beta hydrolase n=1 Tax=Devosia sp. LC5 TaxID=1502724 RepID=UPI0004E31883|nr:alpha/beta hydrolase [Devosia sp. LC5]KFC71188.1 putative lipase/esterase [Devosia sp. LC5]